MRSRVLYPVSLAVVALVLMSLSFLYESATSQGQSATLAAGAGQAIDLAVSVSGPGNGSFLVPGERAEVAVTLKEKSGAPLRLQDFATLGLYAYGPQETSKTVSAVKLLNATADRSKTPHHFIDLLRNPDVRVEGNVLRYTLQPVSDEEPGTYTVGVRAVRLGDTPNQAFVLADFQLGTATVEKQIVEKENCGACHQGASSGQYYFAHTDPSATNAFGSPSLDSWPVRTCKSCHNNEGYAAYRGNIADPTGPSTVRTPDHIVLRVHGVHMGEHLKNPFNINPETGNYRDYTGLLFPANVENCTSCHVDDRWKTQPTRLACGACHDATWFGDAAAIPATFKAHPGGPQANDATCAACHPADTGGVISVAAAHKVSQLLNTVDLGLTPPANGAFYAAGDAPVVTLVIRDDAGNPIDHTTVDVANFGTAGLFVYGPRAEAKPVLTNTAKGFKTRASASNTIAASGDPRGWTFASGDTFKVAVNGNAPVVIAVPAGLQTPEQIRALLASRLSGVTVTATATAVTIRSNLQGADAGSRIDIYDSPVSRRMGWKNLGMSFSKGKTAGVTQEPYVKLGLGSYAINDLRKLSDPLEYVDPSVTRHVDAITYQLDDVAGLAPGTYMIYSWVTPVSGKMASFKNTGIGLLTFQVGTATEEKKKATNCTQCHGNTIWHLDAGPIHPQPFDTDYCLACHDYGRPGTGEYFDRTGGSSTSGWSGFGAVPAARRVHAIHFGHYLSHPEGGYAGNPDAFSEIIFPQDVRNCSKCHDPKTTTSAWKEFPSRLACTGCHDSDAVEAHAKLQTFMAEPTDPFNNKNIETCVVCHGPDGDFSVEKVHNISNPYRPPYMREAD